MNLRTSAPSPLTKDRVAALDGIRGLAIISVFLFHASYDSNTDWLFSMFSWGWMGVDLFFVLSGFLITGILLDAIDQPSRYYYRNFYARRFLRLAPELCFFLVVLFYVFPAVQLGSPADLATLKSSQGWYWSYLVNVLVAKQKSFSATPIGTGPLWSLSVEEQFYLIWPFLIARAGSLRRVAMLSVAVIVAATCTRAIAWKLGYGGAATYVLPFTRADALAWGALLASLVRLPNGTQVVKRCRTPLMVAGAVLLGVVAAMREPNWPTWEGAWMQVVGYPGLAMLCSGLVAFVITGFVGPFAWRPLVRFGHYSYGIYLWHSTVLVLFAGASQLRGLLFLPFGAMFCLLPAAVSWKAFAEPALRLKRFFPMSPPPEAAAATPRKSVAA